jgi:transposase-like protein
MDSKNAAPETLLEAVRYFSDPAVCLAFVAAIRWPDGVVCPRCSEREVSFLSTRRLWKCKGCKKQFSVKVGTIFEDSPLGLDKWLPALWMVVNCKNGISSYELARAAGVTQKSAWFMNHRIRLALQNGSFDTMDGEVEADETFIGGAARFMHKDRREQMIKGRGPVGKVAVMGLLQRHVGDDGPSQVRASVVPNRRKAAITRMVYANVTPGAELFTDELPSYRDVAEDYCHQVINHAESYAEGRIHTNGLENFWSLLKRGIKGTYVSVEPFHLFRYLDEQTFRFNHRRENDGWRFVRALCGIVGRRLTYRELIGEADADGALATT